MRRWLTLGIVAVLSLLGARAEAQRQRVEDGWAHAEAGLAAEAPAASAPAAIAPLSREQQHAAELRLLAAEAAEAHHVRRGDVRLSLRAPRGMEWLWLGDADLPNARWRLAGAPVLCARSCNVSLPTGRIRLGLRPVAGRAVVSEPLSVARPGRVRARYVSRGVHIARAIGLMFASGVLGAGLAYGVFRASGDVQLGLLAGLGIVVTGHVIGFIRLGRSRPSVSLDFDPRAAR